MGFFVQAAAVVALLFPGLGGAQAPQSSPVCRASINGAELTTVVQFEDGYTVEGPWQVLQNKATSLEDGGKGLQWGARLDRIVEVDPATGHRQATAFPDPVSVTFEGHNQDELITRAAQIWCASVMKARSDAPQKSSAPVDRQNLLRST